MVQSVTAIGNRKSAGTNYSVSFDSPPGAGGADECEVAQRTAVQFAAVPFVSLWHVAPFLGVARNWSLSGLKTDMLETWWAV
jgi:hypothetical protein